MYKWKKYPVMGYLSSIDDTDADGLPLDEEFEHTKDEHFTGSITRNQFLGTLAGVKLFGLAAFMRGRELSTLVVILSVCYPGMPL